MTTRRKRNWHYFPSFWRYKNKLPYRENQNIFSGECSTESATVWWIAAFSVSSRSGVNTSRSLRTSPSPCPGSTWLECLLLIFSSIWIPSLSENPNAMGKPRCVSPEPPEASPRSQPSATGNQKQVELSFLPRRTTPNHTRTTHPPWLRAPHCIFHHLTSAVRARQR